MPRYWRRRLIAVGLTGLLVGSVPGASIAAPRAERPVEAGNRPPSIIAPRVAAAPRPGTITAQPPVDSSGLPPPNGTTTLASENVNGDFPSGPSIEPSISENGRWIAFSSLAADLVGNDVNQSQDVFVMDRLKGFPAIL